jgi:hypothetical protein
MAAIRSLLERVLRANGKSFHVTAFAARGRSNSGGRDTIARVTPSNLLELSFSL